jgi:hypothetical protein
MNSAPEALAAARQLDFHPPALTIATAVFALITVIDEPNVQPG